MFAYKYLRINSDPTLNNQLERLIRRVSKTGRSLLTDKGEVTTEVTRLTVYPSQLPGKPKTSFTSAKN